MVTGVQTCALPISHVTVAFVTHDAGGITARDVAMAQRAVERAQQHGGLVRDYPVRLLRVNDAQAAQWLPLVGWAYERSDVPCLQLVYPDKQGRWPWQPDVRDGFRRIQPVLERAAESS